MAVALLDDQTLTVLLVEVHRHIWEAASKAAGLIGSAELKPKSIVYPPNGDLSDSEVEALRLIRLTEAGRSAVTKIIADAAANAFFGLFTLMDAAGDPELAEAEEPWNGVDLTPGIPDLPSFPMLHDEFFESYWKFKNLAGSQSEKSH